MMGRMEAAPELETPALVSVGEWPSLDEADEHALVVLAMNRECWIMPADGIYAVLAHPEDASRIRQEFSRNPGKIVDGLIKTVLDRI